MVGRLAPCSLIVVALAFVSACRTPKGGEPVPAPSELDAAAPQAAQGGAKLGLGESGYYISLAADALSEPVIAFYDRLYGALDSFHRARATSSGRLDAYLNEMDDSGELELAHGDNEIECNRDKCLVRLTARTIGQGSDDAQRRFASDMTQVMIEGGVKPRVSGVGDELQKTYTLGEASGIHITCIERGVGSKARSVCDFALDDSLQGAASAAAPAVSWRGSLGDCVMSPATTKLAEETRGQIDNGQLVSLWASAATSSRVVGYLLYTGTQTDVKFLNLFLCGDLYYDDYVVEGDARFPGKWLPDPRQVGTARTSLGEVYRDDVVLGLGTKLISEEPQSLLVEANFKLRPAQPVQEANASAVAEMAGEGRFYVKIDKAWAR